MTRIAVIPDVQAKPGQRYPHLAACGRYIAEKRPDVIVCLGDFADMPSLSSYDRGRREFEGRRYVRDIAAAHAAMDTLLTPLARVAGYRPRLVMCLGNHENRITRATSAQPELDGLISPADLEYEKFGWQVHPFLKVVVINGIAFAHYLVSGVMGRPITTAGALLAKRHQSVVVGHQQGLQIATAVRADGKLLHGVICGSCYLHDEEYLGPQGNSHFRGMVFLNDARRGTFDIMPLSLKYLMRRFK